MNPIKKVIINNFLGYKKEVFSLSKGVNLIYGNTDSGKSSFIEAIKWALFGLSGKEFIRNGKKEASVKIISDDLNLTRKRNGGKQSYRLNGIDFFDFGRKIPIDIQRAINLNERNIQGQFDPLYVVQTKGLEQELSEVFKLDKIDKAVNLTANRVKLLTNGLKSHSEVIKQLNERLKGLSKIQSIKKEFECLEKEEKNCEKIEQKMEVLEKFISISGEYKKQDLAKAKKLLSDIGKSKKELDETKEKGEELKKLMSLFEMIDQSKEDIEKLKRQIKLQLPKERCKLCGAMIKNQSEYLARIGI